jgi:hypothetical protein
MTLSFRITERDIAILHAIARYRFLTADLAQRSVGGSGRGVGNRLRILTAHGYLVSRKSTVTAPFVFGLANKGARLLAEIGVGIEHRLDWNDKNDRTEHFIDHTLAVAETMLQFELVVRTGAIDLVDHHELLPDMPERTRTEPLRS